MTARRRPLGAGLAIAVGLLLVLAATVGPAPDPARAPGARLTVHLSESVRAVVLGLLAVSAVLLLAIQRRRRPTEEPLAPGREAQRLPPWAAALVSLAPLLLVALGWYLVWRYWSGRDGHPIEEAFAAIAGLIDLLTLPDKPTTSMPSLDVVIAVLLVLLVAAIFSAMVLVAMGDQLERWWAASRERAAGRAPAPDHAGDVGADLRTEPDARVAIIRAYGRFERALAAARAPRAAWQTPAEFMRSTLARLPVPAPPVQRLTALFELARFSAHPLGAEARDAACDSLDAVTRALDEEDAAGAR